MPPPIVVAVALAFLGGCSSAPTPRTETPGAANLRKVGQAYDLFTDRHRRAPRDAEELKSAFPDLGEKGDLDALLRSPRDGQPLVIHYGVKMDSDARGVVLAHEKDGADGNRYVLTRARMVLLMPDDEFATATFPKAGK